MRSLDWKATEKRAREMSLEALEYSRDDAWEAADASWAMERAGYRTDKGSSYYQDEGWVYQTEINRRKRSTN